MQADQPTQTAINEAEWRSRANWHWGIYHSPRDTRVWVPKPIRWTGWTLNFAHRMSYVWLSVLLGIPLLVAATAILVSS
ncbi:DUF5808 domain-containing protein [Botrimarina hoheduenensis]|uniref:DUF5808 domain-containing protein n=1 Tax=Botrimarina hoheduenensis TaxID=2528000 RepID=A0A5C5W889_9BACT|nr:DUF5808 domain-containing protein [Botrimarina hoheduenensis]TWT46667.1 hypothetical protein Pla111_17680 [Botrimarina hoheduenensis]